MPNSNQKGKRGEREFCHSMRELGYGAYRSQQHAGISGRDDSADVITSVDGVRFEVKNGHNKVSPWKKKFRQWIKTAREETPKNQVWAIAWSPDYARSMQAKWLLIVPFKGKTEPADWMMVEGLERGLEKLDALMSVRKRGYNITNHKVDNPDDWGPNNDDS
jgi:Holliday junction resolvase